MDAITAAVIGDIALVFVLSSVLSSLARRCGQPAVIGQILAGVLCGPSFLGHFLGRLFPHHIIPYLTVLAQVAVVLFMFTVGYEIGFGSVRKSGRVVPLLAIGALLVPMSLGMGAVLVFRSSFAAAGQHTGRSFILFVGVATSITALPVLAAIVRERGLAGTTAGTVATAAAGIMDVVAWLVLAAALVGTRHTTSLPLPLVVLLIAGFIVVMLAAVRPALHWWTGRSQAILFSPVPVAFALTMGSAWVTAELGLHPVFGALLAGLTMRAKRAAPDPDVLRSLDQAGNLLLPLFFVVTGLSLNIGSLRWNSIALLVLVVAIATMGKLVPGYGISRACGLAKPDSARIAALLNTRGLTELIALNVGFQDGIIGQRLFTVLVLMALITTFTTGPLLTMIQRKIPAPAAVDEYAM